MKKNRQRNQINLLSVAILFALVAGCTKPEYPSPATSSTPFETSQVLFINALPDDSLIDFAIDNTVKQAGIASGAYVPYTTIDLGPRVIDARLSSTSRSVGYGGGQTVVGAVFPFRTATSNNPLTLSAANSTLTGDALNAALSSLELSNVAIFPNTHYTVVAQGAAGKRSKLTLADVLTQPASGQASIRLVNAVPTGVSSAVLKSSLATVTSTVASRAYNASAGSIQSFTSVNPSANLLIYNGTTSGVLSSISGSTLQAGGIYTILLLKKNGTITNSIIQH